MKGRAARRCQLKTPKAGNLASNPEELKVKNTSRNQYGRFAGVYDKMDADRHSRLMVDYTFRIMSKLEIEATDVLDVCCGTGSAVKAFADHRYNVAGLDQSREMLAVAKQKLAGTGAVLYRKSLPRFEIKKGGRAKGVRQFDLVTSYFDSLNYMLTAKDLKSAFQSVAKHTRPGGWFVFDMNTPHALKYMWDDDIHATDSKELSTIWVNEFDEKTGIATCYAGFFVKKRGNVWERFDETHYERAYANGHIRKMLRETGFTVRGFYRCFYFEPPTNTTNRICVVAQRKK